MADGLSVRVLVRIINFFSLCHTNLNFFVISCSNMISLTFLHRTFYSGVLKMSDREAIRKPEKLHAVEHTG